jgi:4-diphosphocytidyl-2-C-methyl-D-erythritol kinase
MSTMLTMLTLPAPAKINLYLHITGKRADGYHLLDTAFQLIDLQDTVRLNLRDDGKLVLHTPIAGLPDAQHLAMRAAQVLQMHSQTRLGADVWVDKLIPSGAGLGGGSSDAATTLMGLNKLWDCGLTNLQLQGLGLGLGADVPFFCSQLGTAQALGVGEQLTALNTPAAHYVVVFPQVHVATPAVFKHPDLTWNEKRAIISFSANSSMLEDALQNNSGLSSRLLSNDLQNAAIKIAPSINDAVQVLKASANVQTVRMSGSGSAVFASYANATDAANAKTVISQQKQGSWLIWCVAGLTQHPILNAIKY